MKEAEELNLDNKIIIPTINSVQRIPYMEKQIIDFNTFWSNNCKKLNQNKYCIPFYQYYLLII